MQSGFLLRPHPQWLDFKTVTLLLQSKTSQALRFPRSVAFRLKATLREIAMPEIDPSTSCLAHRGMDTVYLEQKLYTVNLRLTRSSALDSKVFN